LLGPVQPIFCQTCFCPLSAPIALSSTFPPSSEALFPLGRRRLAGTPSRKLLFPLFPILSCDLRSFHASFLSFFTDIAFAVCSPLEAAVYVRDYTHGPFMAVSLLKAVAGDDLIFSAIPTGAGPVGGRFTFVLCLGLRCRFSPRQRDSALLPAFPRRMSFATGRTRILFTFTRIPRNSRGRPVFLPPVRARG